MFEQALRNSEDWLPQDVGDTEPVITADVLDFVLTVVVVTTVSIVSAGAWAGAAAQVTATVVVTWIPSCEKKGGGVWPKCLQVFVRMNDLINLCP